MIAGDDRNGLGVRRLQEKIFRGGGPELQSGYALPPFRAAAFPQAWGDNATPQVGIFRSQQMGDFRSQLTIAHQQRP